MRSDPVPSLAWASGTSPAATAAAERLLEPPGERSRSHGLFVRPTAPAGSGLAPTANSGRWVLPRTTKPAARDLAAR
jgi:hypothetical protein